ncbi:MAG: hypothetical protein ACI8T1_003638 [Verrucomicrobiales bacterium]|jgi:hypothetical protein
MDKPLPGMDELKSAEVEARLRSGCIDFFARPEASDVFLQDIHFTKGIAKMATGVGVFVKGARGIAKNRGILDDELKRRYQNTAQHAPIVFTHIVMANTMILHEGQSSPALVVVAFGEGADEAMVKARQGRPLAEGHFGSPENDNERALAALIEDEEYHFGRRRRLPTWLVGNVEAYAADLWFPAAAAFEEGLICEVQPCFAEPGDNGLTSPIPTNLIMMALGRPFILLKSVVAAQCSEAFMTVEI